MSSSVWEELRRRNVFRLVTVYAVGSFVVLQLADILLPALSLADEDIRWVLAALIGLLPFVTAFAWFFELTPEGLKRTAAVESAESITSDTGRRIDRFVIVLLSVAVVFLLVRAVLTDLPQTAVAERSPDTAETAATMDPAEAAADVDETADTPSVAVLPLVNMSSDAENEHFADGLTEELLNALAQNDSLRVAARTSSFYYKGRNVQLSEIGETLGVDHILEGSVRKAGDRIRITVQLIKAADGFHLWSQTYDRELLDVFAVQDEISKEVARVMNVTLVPEPPRIAAARTTESKAAYELFLRANEALYTREEAQIRQALDWFREASSLDASYAPPLLGIAEAVLVWQNNHKGLGLLEAHEIAVEALDRAAELGFETARYWALRGLAAEYLIVRDPRNYALAAQAFERSLQLSDNLAIAYTWYAGLIERAPGVTSETERMLARQRRTQLLEQSLRLDPLNRVTRGNYLINLWRDGEEERFWEEARAIAVLDPEYPLAWQYMGIVHLGRGRLVEGIETLLAGPEDGRSLGPLFRVVESLGEPGLARQLAAGLPETSPTHAFAQAWLRARLETPAEIRMRAEAVLTSPEPDPYGGELGTRLIRDGEYTLARRFIEHDFPPLTAEIPEIPRQSAQILAIYSLILHHAGDRARAREMARLSLAQTRGKPLVGLNAREAADVMSYLVLDRREEAIAEFQALHDAGWRFHRASLLAGDSLFATIAEQPGVKARLEQADAELAEQKDECIALLREYGYLL